MPTINPSLLWDVDPSKVSLDSDLAIVRVLEFGDVDDVRVLFREVPKKKITDVFVRHFGEFDRKTQNYWNVIFDKNIPLTNTSVYDRIDEPVFTRNFR